MPVWTSNLWGAICRWVTRCESVSPPGSRPTTGWSLETAANSPLPPQPPPALRPNTPEGGQAASHQPRGNCQDSHKLSRCRMGFKVFLVPDYLPSQSIVFNYVDCEGKCTVPFYLTDFHIYFLLMEIFIGGFVSHLFSIIYYRIYYQGSMLFESLGRHPSRTTITD